MEFINNEKINFKGIIEFNFKPYLTSNEKRNIIEQAIEQDDYISRINTIDALILRYCTDIEEIDSDTLSEDVLDGYRSCGLIQRVRDMLYDDIEIINDALAMTESLPYNIKLLFKLIGELDVNGITEQLKEIGGKQ